MTVEIPEDDVVVAVDINSGWLLDRLVLKTLKGKTLPALGLSEGGGAFTIEKQDVGGPEEVAVALHGFTYVNIKSKGDVFWNKVRLHFSAVNARALKTLNPNDDDVLRYISNKNMVL